MPAQTRARAVCITLNNPTEVEHEALFNALRDTDVRNEHGVRFAGIGNEVGDNGTPHLQGFICFFNPKTFNGIKRIPGLLRSHIEVMQGTVDQSITYCSKDGDYHEFGEKPEQGKRSDLDAVVTMVKEGKRLIEVSAEAPIEFVKFHKGIERLIALQCKPRDFKTEVHWYYGPTGTGKSKLAFELALTASSYYVKDPLNKWWDGYEQQEVVIIDDYRRDFSTFAHLLRLFDRYPMTVEYKGATTQFRSMKIIVTTPKAPAETWEGRTDEDHAQLLRRIDKVTYFPPNLFIS